MVFNISFVHSLTFFKSKIATDYIFYLDFFVSGYILKKVGHINMMSIVLLAFGVRFILYSLLSDPWWALPIELFQGITFGMFYPTMTSYANIVSLPGTETTVQVLTLLFFVSFFFVI